ncbi:MAG: cysteine desulfurase-like protein [Gammaproteobacteria bacterium]|nr:cysteine desulfurase-like protein [Gammaproteobacteria bacterium]MDH3465133.1 cysteine desulfurase-like protein [Gammaproteobacteria bacterium]
MSLTTLDVEFCRRHFLALGGSQIFFENAGGTLVPEQVIDRVRDYMTESQVQPAFSFKSSILAAERIRQGTEAMAAFLNADPAEIVIGSSTTSNVYVLSHAIRHWFKPGDEVVVTNQDHEANNGAWRRLTEIGVVIKEWQLNPDTAELELADLEALLNDRTRLVCFTYCSNIVGSIYDVKEITAKVHAVGGLVVVDAVAYAGHRSIDVKTLDVDFLLCSLYKFFGPHLGLLYGKRKLLAKTQNQCHDFIAHDNHAVRLNPGGICHELGAGAAGITAYFDAVHRHHYPGTNLGFRERLDGVYKLFATHEESLTRRILQFLAAKPSVTLYGRSNANKDGRVAVISFTVAGKSSRKIAEQLWAQGVAMGADDFYAARCIAALGVDAKDGVLRLSMVHYNSHDDVDKLLACLDPLI